MNVRRIAIAPTLFTVCALLTAVPSAQAACASKVTKLTGTGTGTLSDLAKNGCTPIQFDNALAGKTIIVDHTIALQPNVIVDGTTLANPVAITATSTTVKSIFTLSTRNWLKGLVIQPVKNLANATAVLITDNAGAGGNNNRVTQCTIQNGPRGILVNTGFSNIVSKNSFTGLTDSAISLTNKGNHDFAAPKNLTAVRIDKNSWTLTGDAVASTEQVELYLTDTGAGLPVQGKEYQTTSTEFINDGQFTLSFGIDEYPNLTHFTTLAIATNGDTSTFSEEFVLDKDSPEFTAIVDPDQDGVMNWDDNCKIDANPEQIDGDADGLGNVCDLCPTVAWSENTDTDGDGAGDACDADIDGDGIPNFGNKDNCPFDSNAQQEDADKDGIGDACEGDANNDDDTDGIADGLDNCPTIENPQQEDSDTDGLGNACDEDIDNDGVKNPPDNCPFAINPDQADSDADGLGNACESGASTGGTGANPDIVPGSGSDQDADGLPDNLDNCPTVYNVAQNDPDGDGLGNECDVDDDADSFADVIEGELDLDADGLPNRLDTDSNGDGILDINSVADADANGVPDYLQPELTAPFGDNAGGGCSLLF